MSPVATAYVAATEAVALFDHSDRTRLFVSGRSPAQMLTGVVTGVIPGAPTDGPDGRRGVGHYQTVLTPKGKMISDAWLFLLGAEEAPGFLMDVPAAGRDGILEHFRKFLPPRFARVEDATTSWSSISVVGPGAAAAVSEVAFSGRVGADRLTELAEGEWIAAGGAADDPIIARSAEVWVPAFTAYGAAASVSSIREGLLGVGAVEGDPAIWTTLRVEAGRPAFGEDMDADTLPPEAGIADRAIDHRKGCYTGQEVIVRIRDRGHVNRHLRRLALGDAPVPARGSELRSADGSDKLVGEVTSAVDSPRFGGALALARVRRGVDRVVLEGREYDVTDSFPDED